MEQPIRLLHLEDDPRDAGLLRDQLEADGLLCHVHVASDGPAFEAALAEPWDVVVCDYSLPDYDGLTALARSRSVQPRVPVILLSGSMRPEDAVACMRAGASDYVLKDRPERLSMAVQRTLNDVAERRNRERTEEALRENEERLRLATEAASLESWEIDFAANLVHLSPSAAQTLGLPARTVPWSLETWMESVHAEDRGRARGAMEAALAGGAPYHVEYRLLTPSGDLWVATWGSLVRDAEERPVRLIGLWQDITKRKMAEAEIVSSLHEKEALLREVHHRVNNNLQVIASLLRLEARRVGDPAVQTALSGMRNRIHSMALLHQTLYRSGRFAEVSLEHYLHAVTAGLARGLSTAVDVRTFFDDVHLSIDQAIPCGLIVNELVTNSLKHAFPDGRAGTVAVQVGTGPDHEVRLRVSDNGIGLPADAGVRDDGAMGLQLVSDLVRQLQGDLRVSGGPGVEFEVRFRAAPGRHVPEPPGDPRSAPPRTS